MGRSMEGCPDCKNTGYKGRQGIYEILELSPDLGQAIIAEKRAPELLAIARKNGFRTMDAVGRNFMTNGIITHEEFVRTISLSD